MKNYSLYEGDTWVKLSFNSMTPIADVVDYRIEYTDPNGVEGTWSNSVLSVEDDGEGNAVIFRDTWDPADLTPGTWIIQPIVINAATKESGCDSVKVKVRRKKS